jgi:MFS-type transporter involved in bile tolerance (Atg22 family)
LGVRAFQATTLAAALNDLGSYALIAWHSTFYERVFGLDSSVYAPMLAVILPVGGIVGGVGGGLLADALSAVGGRYWLTCGASLVAAPFIAASLLSDSTADSFLALLVGFAMSEAWRAPSAIMIRTIAPQELGSTASALYLCIRNLVGGAGPVLVAKLAEAFGLQRAMLLTPACYVVSGLLFLAAERAIDEQRRAEQQQQQQLAAAAAAAAAAGAIDVQAVAVTGEGGDGDGDGHGGGVAAPVAGGKVASTPSDHGSSGSS